METERIRTRVKNIIAEVTGLPAEAIADDASFLDDLHLDSLALLEVAVEVDHAFRLGVPEERLESLRTVDDTVTLILECRGQTTLDTQVA